MLKDFVVPNMITATKIVISSNHISYIFLKGSMLLLGDIIYNSKKENTYNNPNQQVRTTLIKKGCNKIVR